MRRKMCLEISLLFRKLHSFSHYKRTYMNTLTSKIDTIIASFDIDMCLSTMKHLNWKWHDDEGMPYLPDRNDFRKHLRQALISAHQYGFYASRGFSFSCSSDEKDSVNFSGGFCVQTI